jgi:hypothetical protein
MGLITLSRFRRHFIKTILVPGKILQKEAISTSLKDGNCFGGHI